MQAMGECSSGEVMNLLANDAAKVGFAHRFFNHLWVCWGSAMRNDFEVSFSHVGRSFTSVCCYCLVLAVRSVHHFHCNRIYCISPGDSADIQSDTCACSVSWWMILLLLIAVPLAEWRSWKRRIVVYNWCQKSWNLCVSWKCTVGNQFLLGRFTAIEGWSWCIWMCEEMPLSDRMFSRHEILRTSFFILWEVIQNILGYTYVHITLLLTYSAMWLYDVRFDTRFFAMASCVLVLMQLSVMVYLSSGVRHLSQYFSAQKRIEVIQWFCLSPYRSFPSLLELSRLERIWTRSAFISLVF